MNTNPTLEALSTSERSDAQLVLYELGKDVVTNARSEYFDIDVEADGKAGYGSMLALGGVSLSGSVFYREIRPDSNLFIPRQRAFCESIGLERDRLLDEGDDLHAVISDFNDWVNDESGGNPAVLTALNASFDGPWVDLSELKTGRTNPFGDASYCIKSLAMAFGLLHLPKELDPPEFPYEWKQTTKSRLPQLIVPERTFTHKADEDSVWQQELHFMEVGLLSLVGSNLNLR